MFGWTSVQADEELQEELFLEDDFTVTMPIWSDAPTPVDTEVQISRHYLSFAYRAAPMHGTVIVAFSNSNTRWGWSILRLYKHCQRSV